MKKLLLLCLFIFLLPGSVFYSRASHIFGGELLYTYVSGNTYKITLTLYGDCGAAASIFNSLYGARPLIFLLNGNAKVDSFYLVYDTSSGTEVSPVCPAQINNTTCHGGTLPGVRRFIYTGDITLSGPSTDWRFIFGGSFGPTSSGSSVAAGRSNNITNVASGSVMELQATLNNTAAANSNPHYSTIPTPFYCINVLEEYNQGATDPDGDSLSFTLVAGIDANTGASVSYNSPYTATSPLSTASGDFTFSALNGQMTFTPNITQDALVVNQVSEYRNGVLVGTSEREMTFIVNDNCNGIAPAANIVDLNGATLGNGNIIYICKGAPLVTFNISISNPDGDTTYLTSSGVPASASLVLNNSGTPYPSANFSWATDTLTPGIYSFFLTIKNNHCPIFNTQTVAYTINVVNFPTITETMLAPTQCIHKAAIQFNIAYGFLPRTVNIVQGGMIISTIIDSSGSDSAAIITDSLSPGSYLAIVSSDSICSASVSFSIADSGTLLVDTASYSLCQGDPELPLNVTPAGAGATINWYNNDGSALGSPPVVNTASAGTFSWYFIENYKTCTSGDVPVIATVHALPEAAIIDIPPIVCFGDQVYLKASGGVQYTWTPAYLLNTDTGGTYIIADTPVTVNVNVTDQNNCSDTASVTYSDIQLCCNFSFPTAFTPNNDGKNDGFRVVTFGNMSTYIISIFDRFGEMVFTSDDPKKYWDGTYLGKPCEIGTYFYFMQAQCLVGPKKFYKGDVTLIR